MNYEFTGFEAGDLVKIDILVNHTPVEALSLIVHRSNAEARGRKLIIKLRRRSRGSSSRSRPGRHRRQDHRPRDDQGLPQGRDRQALRRRRHPQMKVLKKQKEAKADEECRLRRDPQEPS